MLGASMGSGNIPRDAVQLASWPKRPQVQVAVRGQAHRLDMAVRLALPFDPATAARVLPDTAALATRPDVAARRVQRDAVEHRDTTEVSTRRASSHRW